MEELSNDIVYCSIYSNGKCLDLPPLFIYGTNHFSSQRLASDNAENLKIKRDLPVS